MQVVDTGHIVIEPDVLGGEPHIAGHRIAVSHIAIWTVYQGMSPGEIAETFQLTLARFTLPWHITMTTKTRSTPKWPSLSGATRNWPRAIRTAGAQPMARLPRGRTADLRYLALTETSATAAGQIFFSQPIPDGIFPDD